MKIVDVVILSVPVRMMHYFTIFERSSQVLGHNQSMLLYVPLSCRIGVLWLSDRIVSRSVNALFSVCHAAASVAAIPTRTFVMFWNKNCSTYCTWPRSLFFVKLRLSFSGASCRARCFVNRPIGSKFYLANRTNLSE